MKIHRFNNYKPQCYDYIAEGIDIDIKSKKISINLNHEDGVDTSITNNPIIEDLNGINIISIFKRKKLDNDRYDGNPLLYALKGLNGWEINDYDVKILLKQFIRIVEKINPIYDTIIKIPSSNDLNNIFLDRINKIIKCDYKIDEFISKLESDVVWMDGVDFKNMNDVEIETLRNSFNKMGDFFTFKTIPSYLRKYIKKIYNTDLIDNQLDISNKINDKNILILDDTISSGSSISLFTKEILKMYEPKSITIITLFSKL